MRGAPKGAATPAATPEKRRRPGRPPTSDGNSVTPETIIETGFRLARSVPLQDLSIVQVAKAMGVTPALIHYYIGGRDRLTSGIMNLFYRELLKKWPEPIYDWQEDLFRAGRVIYEHFVRYAGVTSYTLLHNRFRIFQLIGENETDYGVEMLERFTGRVAAAHAPAARTGIYAHMMLEYIIGCAHGAVSHRFPSEHRKFLGERVDALRRDRYPNINYVRESLVSLEASEVFREGVRLFILGLKADLLATPPGEAAVPGPAPALPARRGHSRARRKEVSPDGEPARGPRVARPGSAQG